MQKLLEYMNLVGVWNSIPNLGFTSKNGITKYVWYSTPIPMSTNVDIDF